MLVKWVSQAPLSNEDLLKFIALEARFNEGALEVNNETKRECCKIAKRQAKDDHLCCRPMADKEKARSPPQTKEIPTYITGQADDAKILPTLLWNESR
ncbi:hypothetical protein E2542_SST19429 [Spatholobus suberectus]|nr:hypothetical protein E2542_SST19429 [Spatholobus suberectus]